MNEEKCDECVSQSEEIGSCMDSTIEEDEIGTENCSGFVQKTPQLEPEDAFKALYMLIYNLGGEVSIPKASFDKMTDDMRILPSYDQATKRFVLETSFKPPKLIRNRGLKIPKRKLIIP